ncbi:hypothetical protein LPB67_06415 [Undibacterium sp. Jales W-56]|uniref:hypothetical protein n=1 Tax=Undibacterium sp. Jales W-56 TaxID=2897325 RepID=UPI0021D140E1|nr:hypothetical protein [Undibacterium sp. Jales W-56]MCU6433413.1 hypothetical protein [Undibacterium sp. Jales W-56]
MSHLEIILPFAIPPAPLAKDLLRELKVPSYSALIGKATLSKTQVFDDFSRQLPHETVLAGHFAVGSRSDAAGNLLNLPDVAINSRNSSPQDTHNQMHTLGLTADQGVWFSLHPVHIHIARDHLVLTDQRRLGLSEVESRSLFADAELICAELGKKLVYGDAQHWFLRADDWHDMRTATPDAACGHNIDIWMPKGSQERAWRKLQNEIQMQWHSHAINQQRESQGLKPVNSIWLSGGSTQAMTLPPIAVAPPTFKDLATVPEQAILLDRLLEPALNNDWAEWLTHMQVLEQDWFTPALEALRNRQLDQLTLTVSDARLLCRFSLTPWSLKKFWRKNSLHNLFALSTHSSAKTA